ncbi:DUF4214 domain-containing protein [Massilia timonae]|uniref:Peptidase metallopeptidase domain-containing protein n=2 Tax=Massilia timonae TaxID=47229 RepID=K9DYU4_9BURK|nr:DUF4214 domain-containing protein [Massilia timonae]EKU83797.1 hypothetical protein HMPREF9710_00976 [Massilia timonae CCUG 45783]OIJ41314.1 matrixin family protein [Massilia timonae]
MATVSDITDTPLSGLNHIDALLDKGPDWNYLSNSNANVLFYTFSTASGNETGKTGQEAFSAAQQAATRAAFTYLQQITGIEFRETGSGTAAQIHLANIDLEGQYTTGLCSWQAGYRATSNGALTEYTANAYVYLDNAEWRHITENLTAGTQGYETLLHELGHALGLKHSFREGVAGEIVLPGNENNTSNTLMSYDSLGGWHSTYSPYDIAAFNWLYGGDGLRGELGLNGSGGRYITGSYKDDVLVGTQFNDTLQGNGGNDMIDGGAGIDTVVYNGNRNSYTFGTLADGGLAVSGAEGTDTLRNIDWLQFADMKVERANVVSSDTVAPAAPVMAITQNGLLYANSNRPLINGTAEANATIKVYIGDRLIATATADANGLWNARATETLADGFNYQAFATATDAAGNVSANSAVVPFHVDATAPSVPTVSATLAAGGNRPVFTGTGDAGTTIELYRDSDFTKIGSAVVGADGKWVLNSHPLPNGNYNVVVTSLDAAGNARAGQATVSLAINNNGYQAGTANGDTITINPGSTAVDAGAGIDTVVFNGNRADYRLRDETWGFSATAANGEVDGLFNVERIKFNDGYKAIDIDGAAGEVFRLYQAIFDRAPDLGGMGYWLHRRDTGTELMQIAKEFMSITAPDGTIEFETLYGKNLSNEQFIVELYDNVLNRAPDAGGQAYWLQQIQLHSREQILMAFSESPENKVNVVELIAQGIDYVPFA